ncbi:MAG TPA: hypothetical protein VEK05_16415 [Burkholderiales bacterium]|jgi:hypothetical protein|nr:hypothetical protein [Burkholderiales bacterium]
MTMSYEELDQHGRHVVAHLRACQQHAQEVSGSETESAGTRLARLAGHWNSAVSLTLDVRGAVSTPTFAAWLRRHGIPFGTARRLLGQ